MHEGFRQLTSHYLDHYLCRSLAVTEALMRLPPIV